MGSSWEEMGKLELKRRAQERTKAATAMPDHILANTRDGTREGEIAAMAAFVQFEWETVVELKSEVARGEPPTQS
ncbi:hypothetical protein V6N13_096648 [Hibiscus sabdariffa]|uniref:Uncharacterized protein n=1 Tax=Hibiscus sabdariffa TaxID=183260 RepID=A0ABR2A1V8_9ROSI